MSHFSFTPRPALLSSQPLAACRACVVIPVRNERASLPATLDALARQVDCGGCALPLDSFEIIVLLNNCTDDSLRVARLWKARHPQVQLHLVKRSIPAGRAHVGTARRWLMDTAWQRLHTIAATTAILSTDADTVVAPDWIARNLRAIACGARAVGGIIRWKPGHFEKLPSAVQRVVVADRQYQRLQAQLEHMLDPQPDDPWPRHLEHFGASLACTPRAYARAGGLPAVRHLEDVAFVIALERSGVTIRHDPNVIVYTSARLRGRCSVGLSGQLRRWRRLMQKDKDHLVPSARWLVHRFALLHKLRLFFARKRSAALKDFPESWRPSLQTARRRHRTEPRFLEAIQCERLMAESYPGKRDQAVHYANAHLRRAIRSLQPA